MYLLVFEVSSQKGPAVEWAGGMGLYKLFFLASLPLGIFKQVMNLVQLCQAFVELAHFDEKQKALKKKN